MKRVNMDTAEPAVKKFIRSLPVGANGVELTLDGQVVCKVIPPNQLSEAEKAAQLADLRDLLRQSREHSKKLPAAVVERNIRNALKTVRGER